VTNVRALPARVLRALFLWASHRRSLEWLVRHMPLSSWAVRRFVAAETVADVLPQLEKLRAAGIRTTVDLLGESVSSADEAQAAADRYLETIDALAARDLDVNVSLKLTQMGLGVDEALCRENVERICTHARQRDGFVRVDMEDHTRTDVTLGIVRVLFSVHGNVGAVIQSYLRRSADDVADFDRLGIRVRLCKGAYNEPPSVAFATKPEVDRSYAQLMEALLTHGTYPALATHDDRLIARATEFARRKGIDRERFEFQMLYGIRRDLQERLVAEGWAVRVYVPFGSQWYPYFMRRLAERPANVVFLLRSILREGRR
jgi:proline dehydrogenase